MTKNLFSLNSKVKGAGMQLIIKVCVGVYVLSVLVFSGVAEGYATAESVLQDRTSSFQYVLMSGTVYEDHGDLFFEDKSGDLYPIHPSNYFLFEDKNLPVEGEVWVLRSVKALTLGFPSPSSHFLQIINFIEKED